MARRNEALYKTFKDISRENPTLSEQEVLAKVLKARQPCLWVSFFGAYRIVLSLLNGTPIVPKNRARKSLTDILRRRYVTITSKLAFKDTSALLITSLILSEPAEGFFLSETYARKIIGQVRKQKQMKWRKPRTI